MENVKIDRPALKAAAKSKLKGKWGWAVGLTFMTAVFSWIFNGVPAGFTAVQGTDLSEHESSWFTLKRLDRCRGNLYLPAPGRQG